MDTLLSRITIDSAVCHGKPCVRGLRYPVEMLLELLSSGMTGDEALATVQRLYETTGNHLFYPQSPQTVGQRGFVRGWGARRLGGPAARQGG